MAWKTESLASIADPPAESPSTKKISVVSLSLFWQSASFPGSAVESKTFLFLDKSLAFLAASLARLADKALLSIIFPIFGFSSRKLSRCSVITESTTPLVSEFPSFAFVCPSNWGFGSFTEITAVSPSLTSSPERFSSFSFIILYFLP